MGVCHQLYLTTPSHHGRMLRFVKKDPLLEAFHLKVFPEDEGWGSTHIAGWQVAVQHNSDANRTIACAGGRCQRCFARAWQHMVHGDLFSTSYLPWWLSDQGIVAISARLEDANPGNLALKYAAYQVAAKGTGKEATVLTSFDHQYNMAERVVLEQAAGVTNAGGMSDA